ncbi:MAG: hypothetical protein JXA15_01105 [Spirochaetales bacterium]|nr:hypothetical protein [Spirochaetales bacterium]
METKNGLLIFFIFVVLFAFTFIFSLDALGSDNTAYGIYALIGFLVCIGMGFFFGYNSHRNGEALAVWFNAYGVIVSIVFVWFLTRVGTAFGWW